MTVAERVADGWNAFLGRIRHPAANDVTEATTSGFGHLEGHKHCLLVTFRTSGEPMPTPVWFGLDAGKVYARSEARVGKVKRIRANPQVLVAPCDNRGKPLGPAAEGTARIVAPEEEKAAERAIQANFGLGRRMYEGVAMNVGPEGVYIEVSAAAPNLKEGR
jgi:PPOX class probable F420-dependent enzyme